MIEAGDTVKIDKQYLRRIRFEVKDIQDGNLRLEEIDSKRKVPLRKVVKEEDCTLVAKGKSRDIEGFKF